MKQKFKMNTMALFTILLWASAFPMTKVAMTHYTPNLLSFIRCTVASILLLIIGLSNRIRKPRKKDMFWFLLSGGFGFTMYMILFNNGIQTLTSATSSIIITTTPIMTTVVASKLYGEKIKKVGWLAIALAFLGVLILMLWDGVVSINIGLIWTVGAAIVFCCYNILNRKLSYIGYTALEIVTYSMISGAILLALFSIQEVGQIMTSEPSHVLSVIYLGIMPSAIAYLFWGKAMSLADKTSEVTNFMFFIPLFSTMLGFVLLKEIPNMGTFIGGAVIILSVLIFNLKGK
ncbi:Threonine/homoserine efflux transporter RhtA [Clostridium cavendishii DSM 21758]|uniref:Threonine/homoserine efflux transporter RhtA n=1 Tax=Clostridium cavendishii DSM 21758 TaxID=1121302 RepID=A0A1M6R5A2_9CLOT|nr:DMT family transporter [Clostridium cavendishii]SHK27570.1 Threonine/homoserine efflux transporter RhtA [Clostridium cavendishii DSM 21758]